jgi:AcrR family transcriptional regulator
MGGKQTGQPASAEAPGSATAGGRSHGDRAPGDRTARGRILDAAERLFAERGFDHTSTALIAAEARVPQGLIFYHFKTKMELLLAVIREDQATLLDGILPAPAAAAGGPGMGLRQAVAALWRHLSGVLGEPSPVRRIMIQELAAHPEIRQRALELHEQMAALAARYLAQASHHPGEPRPEHEAAARLLTIAAGMAPLLGEPSLTLIPPGALAALISDGLQPRRTASAGHQGTGSAGSQAGIPAGGGRKDVMDTPEQPVSPPPADPDDEPVLPVVSPEDTDAAWGELAEPDDDERLYRDRPPHWDSV